MYQSDLKHSSQTLEEKLQTLFYLNRDKTVDLSFRPPFLKLLEAFGNPQDNLPPVIHVAGTNGKGSIIATLKSIYEAAGYSVHTYTSPHLIRFNERIVLGGKPIDDETLENLIDEALDKNDGNSCTFFEITTAMAFAAFARTPADICLLEVGMGGRLDCTNIIKDPALTIINTIGLDHTEYLGETYKEAAGEKAGIIKDHTPCIIGAQNNDDVYEVFESKAKTHDAELVMSGAYLQDYDPPKLLGPHQIGNLNTALTAIKTLQDKFPVKDVHINQGLQTINWRARLQHLPSKAFDFNDNTKIWLDGGHNEDAAKAIAGHFETLKQEGPLDVILCMMKHKDPETFIKHIAPLANNLYVTEIEGEPFSMKANDLALIKGLEQAIQTPSYREALKDVQGKDKKPANILITGSLYLAGQVLQDIEKQGHN